MKSKNKKGKIGRSIIQDFFWKIKKRKKYIHHHLNKRSNYVHRRLPKKTANILSYDWS